jgi:hypothetical protein
MENGIFRYMYTLYNVYIKLNISISSNTDHFCLKLAHMVCTILNQLWYHFSSFYNHEDQCSELMLIVFFFFNGRNFQKAFYFLKCMYIVF